VQSVGCSAPDAALPTIQVLPRALVVVHRTPSLTILRRHSSPHTGSGHTKHRYRRCQAYGELQPQKQLSLPPQYVYLPVLYQPIERSNRGCVEALLIFVGSCISIMMLVFAAILILVLIISLFR
jgi:hypothetical protein